MNKLLYRCLMVVMILGIFLGCCNECRASNSGLLLADSNLSGSQMEMFSQNDITFYDPDECISGGSKRGGSSTLCGNTATEKYWSALSKYIDDPIKIAGIIGNLKHEGGMNPVGWEGGPTAEGGGIYSNGNLRLGWNYYYSCNSSKTGVGAFAITYNLCKYLHFIGDTEPEFLRYFQNPADYSYNYMYHPGCSIDANHQVYGDCLLEKIGDAEYDRLVEFEVEYAMESFNPTRTEEYKNKVFSSPSDAALWWEKKWEVPRPGSSSYRMASAEKAYAELKDFSCSGTSSESSMASSGTGDSESSLGSLTSDITLIGDSISVYSESELMKKFPGSFLNKVGSRHPTTKGWCEGDEGGLSVLKKIALGSGTILNQHQGQNKCEVVSVDSSSLKENVVWALGTNTNGAKSQSTLEGVLEAVGGRKLYLVTPYNMLPDRMGATDEIADLYRSFADEHDNVYIIDWNKNVRDNVTQYIDNRDNLGVHPTSEGSELFAKLIAEAVSGSKDCTTYEGDYPQYLQCDAKWKDEKYGGSTMCNAGCGPASLAMLITVATGKDVLPTDVAVLTEDPPYYVDNVGGEWKRKENTMKVCEKYGCEAKEIDNNEEAIRQALKDGWMLHLSGGGGTSAEETAFPTDGHYVGIFSIDGDDNVMIADPAGDAHQNKKGRFNRKLSLNNAIKDRWKDRPIMAIRGTGGSGKNTCEVVGNYCEADGSGGGSSATISGEGEQPIGPIDESSENVACDSRTTDIGVRDDGYYYSYKKGGNPKKMRIRLCALDKPGYQIKSSGAEENGRYGVSYSGGYAIVNSRVSGAYAGLAARYLADTGKVLQANSSFRTNTHQQSLCGCRTKSSNEASVASPGKSNHQGGYAVDFAGACAKGVHPDNCHTPVVTWLKNNLGDFGLVLNNKIESWHVQVPWQS